MFRNNFQFELARLVREQVAKDTIARKMQEFIGREADDTDDMALDFDSIPRKAPSSIKQFIGIDCIWTWERVTNILWNMTTAQIDEQIAQLQEVIDNNAAVPGASSRKERPKKRDRESAQPFLKVFLAAGALRAEEHRLRLVFEDGREPLPSINITTSDVQYWTYSPFNTNKLQAMQESRIRRQKSNAATAKEKYSNWIKIELDGKSKKGHWEFKSEEDQILARVFMRSFRTKEDEDFARVYMLNVPKDTITASDVVAETKQSKAPSVLQGIGVVWVEDVKVNVKKRDREESLEAPDVAIPARKVPRLILKGPRSLSLTKAPSEEGEDGEEMDV